MTENKQELIDNSCDKIKVLWEMNEEMLRTLHSLSVTLSQISTKLVEEGEILLAHLKEVANAAHE